jgi:hypothetical protein
MLQELTERRLGLEEQMVAPRQGHGPGARDPGRHAATGVERDAGVVARVHHQGRHAHPREQAVMSVSPVASTFRTAISVET